MTQFRPAATWAAFIGAAALCTALFTALAGSAVANPPRLADAPADAPALPAAPAYTPPGPAFADLIEDARAAVVTVRIEGRAAPQRMRFGGSSPQMDEFLRRFFGRDGFAAPPSAERAPTVRGMGSGFIIDADRGLIVTNNHVIDRADTIVVSLDDGSEHTATLVGTDPKTDLAVLRIDADDLTEVQFGDSDAARIGDWVVAIGNPFGLGGTATVGIISARGRDIQAGPYDDYLQIDAPINQGNSGGPVFDTHGRVIGVNTAIFSPNGGNVGIGFAIPARQAEAIVAQLADNGVVERGWLGVQLQPLDEALAESLGLDEPRGALVVDVVEDSPADRAGLEAGDVITTFDGQVVETPKALSRQVAVAGVDEKVRVDVWRDERSKSLKVVLGRAETPEVAAATAPGRASESLAGLKLRPLDERLRGQLGVGTDVEGVVVAGVEPGSAAAEGGLRPGDIIVQVERDRVNSPADVVDSITRLEQAERDRALVLVRRGNAQRFTTLPIG